LARQLIAEGMNLFYEIPNLCYLHGNVFYTGVKPLALIVESPFTGIPELIASFRRLPFLKPFAKYPSIIGKQ